jgi:addiction module RelE/StbE family toxin
MKVAYQKCFIRQLKKLPLDLQEEIFNKVDLFIADHKNPILKTHKLHGKLKNYWAFRVSYSYRIIFEIIGDEATFIEIGNHDLYRQ